MKEFIENTKKLVAEKYINQRDKDFLYSSLQEDNWNVYNQTT